MKLILFGILAVAGLYLLDKISLWAEARGWIYYRNKRSSGGAIGNAFLELQAFFEPSKHHVIEERKRIKKEEQQSGDKPQAG
jgi:hypothetical protein